MPGTAASIDTTAFQDWPCGMMSAAGWLRGVEPDIEYLVSFVFRTILPSEMLVRNISECCEPPWRAADR